jgi:hypothetical protein
MIAQTIQLSPAPVFVLVAIGQILSALSVRYGRVIDRSRAMQEMYEKTSGREHDIVVMEIRGLDRRIKLMSSAIRTMVLSGLAIGTTVALLFLREIQVSAEMLRIPRKLLELEDE